MAKTELVNVPFQREPKWAISIFNCLWMLASGVVFMGCGNDALKMKDPATFVFELRIPKSLSPDQKTTVTLVASHGEGRIRLMDCMQSDAEGFLVFRNEFLLLKERRPERGLVVAPYTDAGTNSIAQVFRLSNLVISQTNWSNWRRPDYVENGNAAWTFLLDDRKVPGRHTNLPNNCFELRYKIETKK
jgi:hypothetical protein